MTKKNINAAPQVKQPTPEQVVVFTKGGTGTEKARVVSTKRLSLDLPTHTHTRFKTACSATDRKMVSEIQEFIELRTKELEK